MMDAMAVIRSYMCTSQVEMLSSRFRINIDMLLLTIMAERMHVQFDALSEKKRHREQQHPRVKSLLDCLLGAIHAAIISEHALRAAPLIVF